RREQEHPTDRGRAPWPRDEARQPDRRLCDPHEGTSRYQRAGGEERSPLQIANSDHHRAAYRPRARPSAATLETPREQTGSKADENRTRPCEWHRGERQTQNVCRRGIVEPVLPERSTDIVRVGAVPERPCGEPEVIEVAERSLGRHS